MKSEIRIKESHEGILSAKAARALAQLIKAPDCDQELVNEAAKEMAFLINTGGHCNLIPVPDHTGDTTANKRLARAIAFYSQNAEVFDFLTRDAPVESACERHRKRLPPTPPEEHRIIRRDDDHLIPLRKTYFVDNVINSGNTIEACRRALCGFGDGLVYADAHRNIPNNRTMKWTNVLDALPEKGRHVLLISVDRWWFVPEGVREANVTISGYLANDGNQPYWSIFGQSAMTLDSFTHWTPITAPDAYGSSQSQTRNAEGGTTK